MNMEYLNIYLVLLWFLSSEFCSSPHINLAHILLDLHLSVLVGAAKTKYPILSGLKNKCYFSKFWRQRGPRQRYWQIQCLVRVLFLACKWQSSLLCPRIVSRQRWNSLVSSYKGTISIMRTPPSWPHQNLITSQSSTS